MMIDTDEDKDNFVIIYNKYRKLIQKVCYNILKDNQLAEDATHDTFIKLINNMDKVKEIESHETKRYLITIAKNCAIDLYRKCSTCRTHEINFDEMDYIEGKVVYMNECEENKIVEILKHLPALYRDVLLLKYSNCYSNKEIASVLNISEVTVRQRISRGKKMVQSRLEEASLLW
jgi:RNA polymerase sigma-70 factor (ECF subfamily)